MNYPKLTIKKTEKENEIDESRMMEVKDDGGFTIGGYRRYIQVKDGSSAFGDKALYLCESFEWVLGADEQGRPILVPLKK